MSHVSAKPNVSFPRKYLTTLLDLLLAYAIILALFLSAINIKYRTLDVPYLFMGKEPLDYTTTFNDSLCGLKYFNPALGYFKRVL